MEDNYVTVAFQLLDDMLDKLEEREERYGNSGVECDDWEERWRERMHYHFAKGNLVDLANYIAFGRYHGWEL